MEIGRRHRHITQARDAKHVEVVGVFRDVEATLVNGVAPCRFPIIFHHAELLIHPPPTPTPLWHATQPVLMNFSKPALAAGGNASRLPARYASKRDGVTNVRS